MWAGLWQKRCKYSETATAIAYEQHGFFEQVAPPGNLWGTSGPPGRWKALTELPWYRGLKAVPV